METQKLSPGNTETISPMTSSLTAHDSLFWIIQRDIEKCIIHQIWTQLISTYNVSYWNYKLCHLAQETQKHLTHDVELDSPGQFGAGVDLALVSSGIVPECLANHEVARVALWFHLWKKNKIFIYFLNKNIIIIIFILFFLCIQMFIYISR